MRIPLLYPDEPLEKDVIDLSQCWAHHRYKRSLDLLSFVDWVCMVSGVCSRNVGLDVASKHK